PAERPGRGGRPDPLPLRAPPTGVGPSAGDGHGHRARGRGSRPQRRPVARGRRARPGVLARRGAGWDLGRSLRHPCRPARAGRGPLLRRKCTVIEEQLAGISNLALVVAIVLHVLALIGFAADLASSSQRRSDARLAAQDRRVEARTLQSASVSADGGSASSGVSEGGSGPGAADAADPAPAAGSMSAQRFAFLLAGAATVLHVAGVATRALATQRVPWANMYEFATTST